MRPSASVWCSTRKKTSTFLRSSATTDLVRPELHDLSRGGVRLVTDVAARASGWLLFFTDRDGGVSTGPYASLNLSTAVGDDPGAVSVNRARVAAAAGVDGTRLAAVRQVHGCNVVEADAAGPSTEADAIVARQPGTIAGILTADCVPVVVAGPGAVAVAHAGWRGLAGGVIERTLEAVGEVSAAWVGPAIGACCYEVGDDVVEAFGRAGLPVTARDRVDPKAAAAAALRRAGIDSVAVSASCTSCDPRYFSYRRDGVTGRQGAFAARLA